MRERHLAIQGRANGVASAHSFIVGLASSYPAMSKCENDCHLIPQHGTCPTEISLAQTIMFHSNLHLLCASVCSEFIWDTEGHRTCNLVLPFRNLRDNFDSLMSSRNEPYRLPSRQSAKGRHHNPLVKLELSDLEPEVVRIARCTYPVDLCLLGVDSDGNGPGSLTGGRISGENSWKGGLADTGCRERREETVDGGARGPLGGLVSLVPLARFGALGGFFFAYRAARVRLRRKHANERSEGPADQNQHRRSKARRE